jgi:hypothetical protein
VLKRAITTKQADKETAQAELVECSTSPVVLEVPLVGDCVGLAVELFEPAPVVPDDDEALPVDEPLDDADPELVKLLGAPQELMEWDEASHVSESREVEVVQLAHESSKHCKVVPVVPEQVFFCDL